MCVHLARNAAVPGASGVVRRRPRRPRRAQRARPASLSAEPLSSLGPEIYLAAQASAPAAQESAQASAEVAGSMDSGRGREQV